MAKYLVTCHGQTDEQRIARFKLDEQCPVADGLPENPLEVLLIRREVDRLVRLYRYQFADLICVVPTGCRS